MTDSKVSFAIGGMQFSCEGQENWVSDQLKLVLAEAAKLARLGQQDTTPVGTQNGSSGTSASAGTNVGSLATHIKDKDASTNQNRRFLATADWLRLKGSQRSTTSAVTKALKDNNQKRLGNAADCLNRNVSKGFCEKDGKEFFITQEGLQELGHSL